MEPAAIVSKNIKSYRKKLHLNQEEVAQFLSIPREMISYYENGTRKIPIEKLEKLADLFGVEMIVLLEKDPDMAAADLALAFRSDGLDPDDLKEISEFQKIVKNYLLMKQILNKQ